MRNAGWYEAFGPSQYQSASHWERTRPDRGSWRLCGCPAVGPALTYGEVLHGVRRHDPSVAGSPDCGGQEKAVGGVGQRCWSIVHSLGSLRVGALCVRFECCKRHRGCGLRTVLALGGLGVVVLVGFRPQCVASFGLSSGEPSSIVMLGQHICCVRFVPLMCRSACFVHLCRPSLVPLRFALASSGRWLCALFARLVMTAASLFDAWYALVICRLLRFVLRVCGRMLSLCGCLRLLCDVS